MVVGAYLICSTGIRLKDTFGVELKWLPVIPPVKGKMKPVDVRIRAEAVFKLIPERMKKLVIVNSNLSPFEMVQTVADVASKHADEVTVIPALLARLTFALEQLANPIMPDVPDEETILIVTIVEEFSDFVVLRRDSNNDLEIVSHEIYERMEAEEMLEQFLKYYHPNATIFVAHEDLSDMAFDLRRAFHPPCASVKIFKRWDYMLFFGGLFRAMGESDQYDERYHIPNFANGFQAERQNRTGPNDVVELLPARTPVPCDIYSFDGMPQNIQLCYSYEFNQVYQNLKWESKIASDRQIRVNGIPSQMIGHIDERGVPYEYPRRVPVVVEAVKENPARIASPQIAADLSTGNMHEYNHITKSKTIISNAFDPINPYTSLLNTLQERPISTLYIISDRQMHSEDKNLFDSVCNSVTIIPRIKAQLSFCFKKIKIDENVDKFAIILTTPNQLMNVFIFQCRNQQYFFLQRVHDLTPDEAGIIINDERVWNIYLFYPKGEYYSLDLPFEIMVSVLPDYSNMALNGIFEMEESFKYLVDNKDLKSLFALNEMDDKASGSGGSDTGVFSQISSPTQRNSNSEEEFESSSAVTFCFNNDSCSIQLDDGSKKFQGDSKIPLYLSSAASKVEIGEKAREDYKKAPKSVIFDIMKVIGKQLDEIQLDPKWGFELTEQNGVVYFQIETSAGQPKLIPQEIVLAAFFKFLKVRLESENLGIEELKEIRLSTETKLSESQKAVFQKAASKTALKILFFYP